MEEQIGNLDSMLECKVCLERYNCTTKKPMTLICGHCFCLSCLRMIEVENLRFRCPVCKERSRTGVDELVPCRAVLDILDV